MAIVATGLTGAAVENLRKMVSETATFRSLVQAADAAAALSRIYRFEEGGDPARPYAVVTSDMMRQNSSSGGSRTNYLPAGRLALILELPAFWDGVVTSAASETAFTVSTRAGHADDFFNGLSVKFLSGPNSGEEREIADFSGATGGFTLASALPEIPQASDKFRIKGATDSDAFAFILNLFDAIIADLKALSGRGGYLSFNTFELSSWGRSRIDQDDDNFGCRINLEYGP